MTKCSCTTKKGTRCLNAAKNGGLCGIHLKHVCPKRSTTVKQRHHKIYLKEFKYKITLVNADTDETLQDFTVTPHKFQEDTLKLIREDTQDYYLPNALEWNDGGKTKATVESVMLKTTQSAHPYLSVVINSDKPLNADVVADLGRNIATYDDDGNYGVTLDGQVYLVVLRLMK